MIKVENLGRSYGDFWAVKNVNFEIKKGEIVGLLGHNGAGKTTIMKMLTQILEPSEGKIFINDLDISKNGLDIKKMIGFLPENCPMYQELTVAEYLSYIGELKGLKEKALDDALMNVIKKTSIEKYMLSPIYTLSKGYRQRVGLSQAMLGNPPILILDEPTNGLDPEQIIETRRLIKEISKTSTIILSTHILQEVEAICDRVLIMSNGKLVKDETLGNLKRADSIVIKTKYNESFFKQLSNTIQIDGEIHVLDESDDFFKCRIYTPNTTDKDLRNVSSLLASCKLPVYEIYAKENSLDNIFKEAISK